MLRRYPLLKRLLEQYGIHPKRVRLEWVSASEGERFAEVVREMTEEIRALGPLGWYQEDSLEKVASAIETEMTVEGDGKREIIRAGIEQTASEPVIS